MKPIIRRSLLLFLAALSLLSQDTSRRYYVYRTVTSATQNIITIRQPASGQRALRLEGAWVKCSVDCDVTIAKNGTLASGSAGTIQSLDERGAAAASAATFDGTVGSSTAVITENLFLSGGVRVSGYYGGGLFLPANSGSQKQITLSVTSSSGGTLSAYLEFTEP